MGPRLVQPIPAGGRLSIIEVSLSSRLLALRFLHRNKVLSQEPKGLVCITGYSGDMGFPGQVTCNTHTQVPGGGYNFNSLEAGPQIRV